MKKLTREQLGYLSPSLAKALVAMGVAEPPAPDGSGGSDQRREALMAESMQTQRRVIDWRSQSDEGLRLRCGELSAQEIRTIRAVLNAILPPDVQGDSPG